MKRRIGLAGLLMVASGCGIADGSAYTQFTEPRLVQGRAIWLENCEGCHGYGTAGAPVPMVAADWYERVEKPRETLYKHAIDGFFGPEDTMMPPRGGNEALTDPQVKAAVDYMTALANFYLQQEKQMR